jgi:glucose-1-phosphate cytidylyltransferase
MDRNTSGSGLKVVLLAGGLGTRLSEETIAKPKPMVEIGGIPILVHIMSVYGRHGLNSFVIACGYRGEVIKDYFSNYLVKNSDWHITLQSGKRSICRSAVPNWDIWAIDTGLHTMTGGRISRLRWLLEQETFLATYGDGVADIDVTALMAFHRAHGKLATITAVRPPARFGCLEMTSNAVTAFTEKPQASEGWINGGFFVFEPGVFNYLGDDTCYLEKDPLERLARDGQLMAYQHHGFWQPMDTLREKNYLESLWESGKAPWKAPEQGLRVAA